MSHSHRDDNDLTFPVAAPDAAIEPAAKPPAMTNSEVARAAAAARKKVEEQAPSEPIRERKFLGDGDGAASRRMGPPADDDETVSIAGHVSSASGPPQPRFGCHADETSWLGEHSFETYGFADALPTNSWLRVSPPAAVRVFSLSSRWI